MPVIDTKSLPDSPGVYMFFNRHEKLIYVGKAKNIRKRVASYSNKQSTGKLKKLVSEISRVKYTITGTEHSALLLENNLIKKNQPRYNILLKDGKTYPYICISKERFPRIIATRKFIPEKGEYFGPYTNVSALNNTLDLLRRIYAIRSCQLNLSKESIAKKKFKVCLEYHIGNCKGPCIGLQPEKDYDQDIASARNILRGKITDVVKHITEKMNLSATKLEFESAAQYKNQKDILERFQANSQVTSKHIRAADTITITSLPTHAFINYMQIREGSIMVSRNMEIVKKMDETDSNILSYAIHEVREKYKSTSTIVLSNKPIALYTEDIKNSVPQIGEKRKLVMLSLKNAFYQRQLWEAGNQDKKNNKKTVLDALKEDLHLGELPRNIECFDISNFHSTFPVASMVSFIDGKPKKSNYCHYNIKTIKQPNDFAAIYEVVRRRYKRLIEEHKNLPDLIIIDGGKGQLSHACKALNELGLYDRMPIISIAKKLEEIYRPNDSIPLHIDRRSAGLLLIQKIRNEAHRFAVTFHRLKRKNKTLEIAIKNIAGMGEKTTEKLLGRFKSWKKLKAAPPKEIENVIGKHKASILIKVFAEESISSVMKN